MQKYKTLQEFRSKLETIKNYDELIKTYNVAKKQTKNNDEQILLKSYINKDRYSRAMSIDKFMFHVDIINAVEYREDAMKILNDIELNYDDAAQLNTLKKLVEQKSRKSSNDIEKIEDDNRKELYFMKYCPHCEKKNVCLLGTSYIICGYSEKGYDWIGCGRDWCFKCGKKLCKHWNTDQLFNKLNRYHNNKCCRSYATKVNDKYPQNYCSCFTENVNR